MSHHNRHHHHQQQQQQQQQQVSSNRHEGSSRSRGISGTGGEIVEVQGGHIIRSIGRKDRHSKVCTSKGPRDRRVRLSAHTAIQFYDVQDRLGYDRPSKAVDWLIKNAKSAIDELAELPPWQPTTATSTAIAAATAATNLESSGKNDVAVMTNSQQPEEPNSCYGSSYGGSDLLPPSLESDAIADTIKFFFPIATAAPTSTSSYPQGLLLSRASTHTQDLRLSLQSFHDPGVLMHSHSSTTSTPLAYHRNPTGGEIFNLPPQPPPSPHPPPQAVPLHHLLVQGGTAMTQRGTLQSNSSQPFRSWNDHVELSGFAASGGFPSYSIPARFHGDDDDHIAGVPGKLPPSSRR